MRSQQGVRALSRAIDKEWRFLAGDLQNWGTKRTQKVVSVARAKSGANATGHDNDSLMSILPPRVTQCTRLGSVWWNFCEPNRCVAVEVPEATMDACGNREATVKQWQSLNLSTIRN
jgi:hypothetical protein